MVDTYVVDLANAIGGAGHTLIEKSRSEDINMDEVVKAVKDRLQG